MNNESGNISAAQMALVGLIVALLDPPGVAIFAEAWRIVFSDSVELKRIAAIIEIDFETLQKNTRDYLNAKGFQTEKTNYH